MSLFPGVRIPFPARIALHGADVRASAQPVSPVSWQMHIFVPVRYSVFNVLKIEVSTSYELTFLGDWLLFFSFL